MKDESFERLNLLLHTMKIWILGLSTCSTQTKFSFVERKTQRESEENDDQHSTHDNTNELAISILNCSRVKGSVVDKKIESFFFYFSGRQPDLYCVYKFHDFDDHLTVTISSSNNPSFNGCRSRSILSWDGKSITGRKYFWLSSIKWIRSEYRKFALKKLLLSQVIHWKHDYVFLSLTHTHTRYSSSWFTKAKFNSTRKIDDTKPQSSRQSRSSSNTSAGSKRGKRKMLL